MFRTSQSRLRRAAGWGSAALVAAVVIAGATPDRPAADGARVLPLQALRTALQSLPPEGGVMRDELDFFVRRLRERPDDPLARRRIVTLSLLRFRAQGARADLERAATQLERLEPGRAGDASVHAFAAALALAEHRFDDALRAALRRRALAPAGDLDARLAAFDALWATGRHEEARTLLEARPPRRESAARLSREARLIDGLGDTEGARGRAERVVRLVDAFSEPPVVRAWARVELGHFTSHSGDPHGAVRYYLAALSLVPGYSAALEGLGWIAYGVDHDLPAAEALFRRAFENGGHLDLLPLLAEVVRARGAVARAEAYRDDFLDQALASSEVVRSYWRPLAMELASDAASLADALGYAEADLAQREDRGAWVTRAWVLHRMGRTEEALADVERALAWGAPEPGVLALAGRILLAAGHERRGEALLRDALEGSAELGPVRTAEIRALLAGREGEG